MQPTYANDNPLRFIDPDGMAAVGADGLTNEQWLAARGNAEQEGEFRNENKEEEKDKNRKKADKKTLPTVEQAQNSNGVNGLNPNGDGIEADYTLEGLYISQKTFNALGKSFGKWWRGIFGKAAGGTWVTTNESMSLAAAEYQTFITGRAANESYLLRGVKFDGLIDDVLVDAKSGYGNFVDKSTGGFHRWFNGAKSLLEQAERQIGAANGAKIQWYFQNNATMQATQKLFNKEGVKGIELIFKSN